MEMPPHPLTLDGSAVLHQMFRVRWSAWRELDADSRFALVEEAQRQLKSMNALAGRDTALFSVLGHKADLLVLHFRPDFEELAAAESEVSRLGLFEHLEPTTSYVSVVELGLYDSSVQLYRSLLDEGVVPDSDEWKARVRNRMEEQSQAMAPRLEPAVPGHKYLCFYPMDKKRDGGDNWYSQPIEERRRMMREHGLIGRRFAGRVRQIISGSIGFDDWEWGVDLFADDPLVFKQLIYEMRFDEASALYALFGPFYLGLRLPAADLGKWFSGNPPS